MDKFKQYGSLYSRDFTVEKGIDVQSADLARWKKLLNEKAYKLLVEKCRVENNDFRHQKTGYDVFRGNQIDTFVHNLHYKL